VSSAAPDPLMGMVPRFTDVERRQVGFISAGAARFSEAFFDESIMKLAEGGAARTCELGFDDLRRAVGSQVPAPAGLIFHVGRCGSTLLTKMLMHDRTTMSLSEPTAIGLVHWDAFTVPDRRPVDEQVLLDLLVVFDRFAAARGQRPVAKLSSWETADSARLLELLPDVPAVFVHRPPAEVVASQLADEPAWGRQLASDRLTIERWAPQVAALSPDASKAEVYAAIWASLVSAVLDAPRSRVLFVGYADLAGRPIEVLEAVATHFGLTGSWNRATARSELGYYAKSRDPAEKFDPQGRHARDPLPPDTAERVETIVGDVAGKLVELCGT
jgi:hypothetical protein